MRKSHEIQQDLQTRIADQQAIADAAVDGDKKRALTEDEATRFDALQTEIEALEKELTRTKKFEETQRKAAAAAPAVIPGDDGEGAAKAKVKQRFSVSRAIGLVKAGKPLDGLEAEMAQEAIKENRAAGVTTQDDAQVHIPSFLYRADGQTVSEDSGSYGGFAVVDDMPKPELGFSPKLFLEELGATRYSGLTGGDIPIPVFNDYTFAWYAETADVAATKNTIAGPKLSPNRTAVNVNISNRWLMQNSTGDAMIMTNIMRGYNRALESAAINGSGASNQPTGILNTAGIQESAILLAAGAATWAQMVELPGLVQSADAPGDNLAFLLKPELAANLKGITRDSGSGRYLMEGNTIDGTRAYSTSLVPDLSGQHVLICGDFRNLAIGEWGAISIFIDPYTKASANSIRAIVNAHADVAIAQPSGFAVNRFINPAS